MQMEDTSAVWPTTDSPFRILRAEKSSAATCAGPPWKGLVIGSSIESQDLDGSGPQGTLDLNPSLITAYYAEWTRGKWYLVGEYWRLPLRCTCRLLSLRSRSRSISNRGVPTCNRFVSW